MKTFAAAAVLLTSCLTAQAGAQSGPAGNAHPDEQLLVEGPLPNPFAPTHNPTPTEPAQKKAFADALNLAPLRDIAVFHNGRVKVLDTLARETIRFVAGRKNYLDHVEEGSGGVKKLGYDPLFTFFDTLIDPDYYMDKPLVHVEFLPLRKEIVGRAVDDPTLRERWLKLTRLSPAMIGATFDAVAQERGIEPGYGEALQAVRGRTMLYSQGYLNLIMLAPASADGRWEHVASDEAPADIAAALKALGERWRAMDAGAVNEAITTLADLLPAHNTAQYPASKRSIEAIYNRAAPFEYGYWLYAFSFLLLVLAVGTGRKWLAVAGQSAFAAALLLHVLGFAARWVIAERLPIQNQFESMTGLSLGASLVGGALMVRKKQWLFGAAAAGAGFLILILATQTAIPGQDIGREAAILNTSVLLKYHVTSVLVSYGLITLAMILSCFYLFTHYAVKLKGARAAALTAQGVNLDAGTAAPARVLADLDKAQMTVLQIAFWILGVGILLGAWWADHSWGRWWAFDPKETWALVTWIIYLIVIHVRIAGLRNKGLATAWLSVVGFVVMLWTYFGVNLLLPGLHAYA